MFLRGEENERLVRARSYADLSRSSALGYSERPPSACDCKKRKPSSANPFSRQKRELRRTAFAYRWINDPTRLRVSLLQRLIYRGCRNESCRSFYCFNAAAWVSTQAPTPVATQPRVSPEDALRKTSLSLVSSYAETNAQFLKTKSEQELIDTTIEVTRNQLKDPSSAQFRKVRVVTYGNGKVVCGEVNGQKFIWRLCRF